MFLLFSACLVDWDTYYQRKDFLTDNDGDGLSAYDGDCDDHNAQVFPGADEYCNDIDDNCDGEVDIGAVDAGGWYPDEDGDGYGDASQESTTCAVPTGWIEDGSDCDDGNATISPDADEYCNSIDDDCDGGVDEKAVDAETWYIDEDGDEYGQNEVTILSCIRPDGTSPFSGDCNDADPYASPGADEVCGDGIDNDCDGDIGACGWETTIELKSHTRIFGVSDEDIFGISGVVEDLDGDGQPELLIGAYYALDTTSGDRPGALYSFDLPFHGSDEDASVAERRWIGQANSGLAYDTDAADVNGDGFVDLIVSAFAYNYAGRGHILYGPVTSGFTISSSSADWAIDSDDSTYWEFSRNNHVLGDIDGDGIEDFAMGSAFSDYNGINNPGVTYIYTTASSGLEDASESAHAIVYGYDDFDTLGYTMLGADLDGDGANEVVIGAIAAHYGDGEVYLFEYDSLQPSQTSLLADQTWVGEDPSGAGGALDAGDLDGDGIEDLLIGGDYAQDGSAYLVWGDPNIEGYYLADAPIRFRGDRTTGFGFRLRIGDLNNDDVADIIIGEGQNVPDDLYMFFGPFSGSATFSSADADVKIVGDTQWDEEYEMILIEDVTDDGLNDLVIGSQYGGYDIQGLTYLIPGTGW